MCGIDGLNEDAIRAAGTRLWSTAIAVKRNGGQLGDKGEAEALLNDADGQDAHPSRKRAAFSNIPG